MPSPLQRSSFPRLAATTALAAFTAFTALACGGGGDCDKAYEMEKKCNADKDGDRFPSKSDFVDMCSKMKDDPKRGEEVTEQLACAKESSCEAYKACSDGLRGKRRAKKIAASIEAGKWDDAFSSCTMSEEYYADETYKTTCSKVFANTDKLAGDAASSAMFTCKRGEKIKAVAPDFEKACKTLAGARLAGLMKTAAEARDAGKRDYKVCLDLKDVAEVIGGDAPAKRQQVCDEMNVAEDAKKAIDEARANVTAKKRSVPFRCSTAADKLAKVDSEWGKKTLDEVLKACFVELAGVVFEGREKDAKYSCPYDIRKMKEEIEKYGVAAKFPEVTELQQKLPAKCTKS